MKLYRENIIPSSNILVVKEEHFTVNEFPLHFHPEYELILILNGSGKRFVGDNIAEFSSGDLCFFGPNLPHTYSNKHIAGPRDIHQIVVQFNEDFLGKGFFDKAPFKPIRALLDKAIRGFTFTGETLQEVTRMLRAMVQMDETAIVIQLLSVLHTLAKSAEFELLSSRGFSSKSDHAESERMGRVLDYILRNFKEEIPLNDIASVACLSPEAFCRYFKKYTRKTFSEFLIEVRIGHACKLLQQQLLGVNQISLQSGFNNISYFNRKFKSMTKKTPVEYQKMFAAGRLPEAYV
ncbi:helix-turn-helix domain-containing protein [Chitinophaga sp. YR627]|uniref:helix-turn-helix domain-containing protein n=1 Tax=Chitinophaga sp. YR627 TaxID=1881041 RepID=UPI000B7C6E83|nr:AraC family transcriptional regulator [Chitinophaga sp. YR627]